jgi:hypothetical protein
MDDDNLATLSLTTCAQDFLKFGEINFLNNFFPQLRSGGGSCVIHVYQKPYVKLHFAEVAGHLHSVVKLDLPIAVDLTASAELAVCTLPTLYFLV